MLSILIVDDHELARNSLSMLVSTMEGFTVCDLLSQGADVIPFVKDNSVDIVLLDLNLGGRSGLSLLAELSEHIGVLCINGILFA